MNPEEKDFQIEDNIDFSQAENEPQDLTPEVKDFEEAGASETPEIADDFGAQTELDVEDHGEEESDLSEPISTQDTETQKETPSTNSRVMRYEDFVKNL